MTMPPATKISRFSIKYVSIMQLEISKMMGDGKKRARLGCTTSIGEVFMAVMAFALSVNLAWAQEAKPTDSLKAKTGFDIDKIIAKVDNYIVLRSELADFCQVFVAT